MTQENEHVSTGRYFYAPGELTPGIEGVEKKKEIEAKKFVIHYIESDENLCDYQDADCGGDNRYYTDDEWFITYFCENHHKRTIADGTFIELKAQYLAIVSIFEPIYAVADTVDKATELALDATREFLNMADVADGVPVRYKTNGQVAGEFDVEIIELSAFGVGQKG